jgi:hypothetical protein
LLSPILSDSLDIISVISKFTRAMNLLIRYFNLKGFSLFIGIVIVNLLLIWLSKTLLINEVVFYNAFSEQLTYERSLKLFEEMHRFSWISYALTPIILLVKFSLVSIVIYIGIVFYDVQKKISLGSVFKIVIASEIIFVSGGIIKLLWFYLVAGNYDFNDLNFFYPLSIINFFSRGEVAKIWIYPMQTINIFHLIYILLISFGLSITHSLKKSDTDKIVFSSYLPGLVLLIVLVMFLTIEVAA